MSCGCNKGVSGVATRRTRTAAKKAAHCKYLLSYDYGRKQTVASRAKALRIAAHASANALVVVERLCARGPLTYVATCEAGECSVGTPLRPKRRVRRR